MKCGQSGSGRIQYITAGCESDLHILILVVGHYPLVIVTGFDIWLVIVESTNYTKQNSNVYIVIVGVSFHPKSHTIDKMGNLRSYQGNGA